MACVSRYHYLPFSVQKNVNVFYAHLGLICDFKKVSIQQERVAQLDQAAKTDFVGVTAY